MCILTDGPGSPVSVEDQTSDPRRTREALSFSSAVVVFIWKHHLPPAAGMIDERNAALTQTIIPVSPKSAALKWRAILASQGLSRL